MAVRLCVGQPCDGLAIVYMASHLMVAGIDSELDKTGIEIMDRWMDIMGDKIFN